MSGKLRVGIIGAGNIGSKRAVAITKAGDCVAGVFDIDGSKMHALARAYRAKTYASYRDLLADGAIDSVVVAALPKASVGIVKDAIRHNKPVLAEKPLGETGRQAADIADLAKRNKVLVKAGFNHRFHPALERAHSLFSGGAIGELLFIRALYGHGARAGYGKEWRMRKKTSRGGELMDQGVHLLDLAEWFLPDVRTVFCRTERLFWLDSDLEDNAFCQLSTKKGAVMDFQVSCSLWKNTFEFLIFGTKGYLLARGLGRSYGTETLTLGQERVLGKPYREKKWEFPGEDESWLKEWKVFRSAVQSGGRLVPSDAGKNRRVMHLLDCLYQSAKSGTIITVNDKTHG